jgi:hypothetical protein
MKRKTLLIANASIAVALSCNSKSNASESTSDQPMNVLFLVIDDLNTWLLGDPDRYDGKVIAPNIRRLAASGVLFNRGYTASPVCSPSRTALMRRPTLPGVRSFPC